MEYGFLIDEKQKIATVVKRTMQYYTGVILNKTNCITATGIDVTTDYLIEATSMN